MHRNVVTTDFNPHTEYPICRFQLVDYTDKPVANGTANGSVVQHQVISESRSELSNIPNKSSNVAQTIANMHQRATELLQRMKERRQWSTRSRAQSAQECNSSVFDGLQYMPRTYSYLDSGGSVHGPMDQKHSTRLGNISRSGHLIPGSRYYLTDANRVQTTRRQSDSVAWDVRSESAFRNRTFSDSRRPFSTERTNEISSRYFAHRPSYQYRTTAHHVTSPPGHISRWSSMQNTASHGLWRGPGQGRYATTVTRQHIKRHHEPVEMVVKHAPSAGASRIDLVSIDNRRSPPMYSPNTYNETDRERHLQEELMHARRELQELKRSRSLTGEHDLLSPSGTKQTWKSTSTQYLNEGAWTTHTLKKNDGLPCGARISSKSFRIYNDINICGTG